MNFICRKILDDITFLSSHRLMDYSLLLITEKNPDYQEVDKSDAQSRHDSTNSQGFKPNSVITKFESDRMTVIPEEADDDNDRTSIMNGDTANKKISQLLS